MPTKTILALALALCAPLSLANTYYQTAPSTARLKTGLSLEQSCRDYYAPDDTAVHAPTRTGLLVLVQPNGSISEAKLTESSGSATLDQAFLSCLTGLGSIYDTVGVRPSWHDIHINWAQVAKSSGKNSTPSSGAFFNVH